ncbi:hypothetical protein BDR05DRAFT_1015020 [Suillus weaverae]|nr:hypothetical protein BDR05DRAFT_1015020 [Suillus weaverae]
MPCEVVAHYLQYVVSASILLRASLSHVRPTTFTPQYHPDGSLLSSSSLTDRTHLKGHTGYKGASSAAMDVQRFIQLFGGLILHSTPHLYRSKPGSGWGVLSSCTRAVAQARAEPKPAVTGGFGPAWNFRKPKPSEARPKPRLSSQAGPEHH